MSMDGYLEEVRRGLAGMDSRVRADIVQELRSHLAESVAANGGNVSAAISGLGDARAVAKRYRELYGFGAPYRVLFAGIAGVLGIFTVPVLFASDEGLFPFFLSAVFLSIAFVVLIWTSLAAGNRAGLVGGVTSFGGRLAGLGIALLANRGASLVTLDGLALFLLVSLLLVVVGWIPGRAKEAWRRPGAEL